LGNIPSDGVNLPSDFAKKIAKSLGMTDKWVDEWFEIDENKEGYFIAKLKPKKFLEKDQFRTLCALARDLGGEGYLQGAKAWAVPGPFAKKPLPSTSPPSDVRSEPQPSTVTSHVVSMDKSEIPNIPNLKFIPVDAIKIPDFLPTRVLISHERLNEITNSIKKHGLKYPIKVRRANSDYELIDGYLRLKSVLQLGWKGILAEIKDATDQEVVVESLITNKYRIEEDPITVAKKFDILINAFGFTQEKLAEEIGLDRTTIAHMIRLLKLPKEIQHSVALHNVSFYHALLLLTVENPDLQVQLAKEVVDNGLSTRQLEERIRELQPRPVAPSPPEPSAPSQQLEQTTQARRAIQQSEPIGPHPGYLEPYPEETAAPAPSKELKEPEPKPEPIDIAEVSCPVCGITFRLAHHGIRDHRVEYYTEGESK
jgi:ParB family chromosome partitioning protein